jgi:hypothetical protein
MRKMLIRSAVVAVAGTAVLFGVATPAFALPSCVRTDVIDFNTVRVVNNCLAGQNVKVIWSFHPDSPCTFISYGSSKVFNAYRTPWGEYDRTVSC